MAATRSDSLTRSRRIQTPVTGILGISHPVMLAGMSVAAGPRLAAAVTNAGGIGIVGGGAFTPKVLRESLVELKGYLDDKDAPFGVDMLIPQLGGNARKTNYDLTKGKLDELVQIIIDMGARLFVCAVGVPPKDIVDKLHNAGVLYMNIVGHPKHIRKCLDLGADFICAQGSEGGGHTGEIPTSILIPEVVRLCRRSKGGLTGLPVQVVAAGGIFNGQTLAAALSWGASAVWVGTRFILAEEAGASHAHQEAVRTAGFDDTTRTLIFTGRPLRVRTTAYIKDWEENRQKEIKQLTSEGVVPVERDLDMKDELDDEALANATPFLMGNVAAAVDEIKSARNIVDEMVQEAVDVIDRHTGSIVSSKL